MGGGVVLDDVIVAQPTEGEFVAFTAVCTHQGGKITTVDDEGVMTCSLHGSQFSIEGGENLRGANGDPAGEHGRPAGGGSHRRGRPGRPSLSAPRRVRRPVGVRT